jgi:hypothetical protein
VAARQKVQDPIAQDWDETQDLQFDDELGGYGIGCMSPGENPHYFNRYTSR